jgi:hypothetical protein
MEQPGLNQRHRDKDGEIGRKHGKTPVATMRRIYGASFAKDADGRKTLSEILAEIDERSLNQLVQDHLVGTLEPKIRYVAEEAHS